MTDTTAATDYLNVAVLAVTLLTTVFGLPPLIVNAVRLLRKGHRAEELRVLRDVAEFAVRSVEQEMKRKGADGKTRFDAAMEIASTQLLAYGITVDHDQLRAMIEAAVWAVNTAQTLPAPPATDPVAIDPASVPVP